MSSHARSRYRRAYARVGPRTDGVRVGRLRRLAPRAANNRRFRRALKAAHLDASHRIHDLRHTFGTRMAAVGTPMRTLQEWMGHRDIATTQRYADYAPSTREAELIAAAFSADAGGDEVEASA